MQESTQGLDVNMSKNNYEDEDICCRQSVSLIKDMEWSNCFLLNLMDESLQELIYVTL